MRSITIDKYQHALGCAILTSTICALPFDLVLLLAGPVVFLIGLGKEVYDYFHPDKHTADWKDLVADCIGITIVYIPCLIQRFL